MKKITLVLIAALFLLFPATRAPGLTAGHEREKKENSGEKAQISEQDAAYPVVEWDALVPEDWNPRLPFEGLDINSMEDNDPRLARAVEQFKKLWDDAPVNAALKGKSLRIAGFLVALDYEEQNLKEFLLVPYFGACIHAPPPPANQIIYVTTTANVEDILSMEPVWVYGVLDTDPAETELAKSGYTMEAVKVERYQR
ncbi:MAG: DUF3299 domain-containing protein [Desulfovibrio sp.]|jgi:hypothetical protein|nr:DUF3299 domain-containing protein [Desulfovibrio sp.]